MTKTIGLPKKKPFQHYKTTQNPSPRSKPNTKTALQTKKTDNQKEKIMMKGSAAGRRMSSSTEDS